MASEMNTQPMAGTGDGEEVERKAPWVEKYRPRKMEDVQYQDEVRRALRASLSSGELPHLLFYGPPGTGKTSMVLAVARELFGPFLKHKVLELNASDERGIEVVRRKIKVFAQTVTGTGSAEFKCPEYKLIILDEADAMTEAAQAALRRVVEDYSSVTRFCLICNYVSRIIDPLASRCAKFRFRSLGHEHIARRLESIAGAEGVRLGDGAVDALIVAAGGDMRRAITYLQSAATLLGDEPVDAQTVADLSGTVPPARAVHLLSLCKAAAQGQHLVTLEEAVEDLLADALPATSALAMLRTAVLEDSEMLNAAKAQACMHFSTVDKRLADGADERVQLLHMLSVVVTAISAAAR